MVGTQISENDLILREYLSTIYTLENSF